ncbi:hypothetical protein BHM03_00018039 [Ensete ventricosum]|nr:hypothetical protein BHM03_00018039 [Ensete ventricosum]
MHRVDAVGNSPGVRRELAEGIGSLPGWRKGVRQKKTETRRKIVGGEPKSLPREIRRRDREARKVEGTTFEKIPTGKPSVSDGCTVASQAFGRLTTADPPRLGG